MASTTRTTMEGILPKRILKIARHLSVTPIELIEPVIADLPLHHVLDLLSTAVPGSALEVAIGKSTAWRVLRGCDIRRVAALWLAFNQTSMLSEGKLPIHSDHCKPWYLDEVVPPRCYQGTDQDWLEKQLEVDLTSHFVEKFISLEQFRCNSSSRLKGVCKHLPAPQDLPVRWRPFDGENDWAKQLTADDCMEIVPQLMEAHRILCDTKAAELRRLADLYDLFPTYLRVPYGPYRPPHNFRHVPGNLRSRARKLRAAVFCFRYAHTVLVPYDWCFQLFNAVDQQLALEKMEVKYEQTTAANHGDGDDDAEFEDDLRKARDGIRTIYTADEPLPVRLTTSDRQIVHDTLEHRQKGYPSTLQELEWLEAFLRCVKRMEVEFPRLAADFKESTAMQPDGVRDIPTIQDLEAASGTEAAFIPDGKGVLLEASDFRDFIQKAPAESVAEQLRADLKISKEGGTSELPSLTALYMPDFSSSRARDIAKHIWTDDSLHVSVRQMLYEQMLSTIKNQLSKAPRVEAADGQAEIQAYEPRRSRKCYICHMDLNLPHKTLKAMCVPCGDFNLAERALSLPHNLSLIGSTALVTGGRINLGFHTALRLLRCGAFVIASSRYPEDALCRYERESDYSTWATRLRIVGADFRTAKDAFALVEAARMILRQENRKLDILINNAAQTLTDPIEKEQRAIDREQRLLEGPRAEEADASVVIRQGYTAQVRGGAIAGTTSGGGTGLPEGHSSSPGDSLTGPMSALQVSEPTGQSSWVQSLSEIPYEDIITAHSVNTFVPLILIRELLPWMARGGHIVNVSSREGVFESDRRSSAKAGKHVHTNMSKAGLNMITETEASTTWEKYKVAMNTVDPGYMSAAPEFELSFGGERPIGWEDGAGRVLWPIAKSGKNAPIWGRFLKHYGAARLDTRFGRG